MSLYQQGLTSLKVSIAFGANASDYSFLATDVTQYVRSVSITRGKTDDFQDFSSGQASVVLDNRTRIFDPSYTSGPFFGQLKPRTRIIVQVIDSLSPANTHTLFNGFIGGWPQTYDDYGKDSTVTLPCYDLMALISQIDMPTDPSKAMVLTLSDAYTAFYRFGDFTQQGDLAYDSTGNGYVMYCTAGPPVSAPAGTNLIGPELAPELNGTSSLFAGTFFTTGRYIYTNRSASLTPAEKNLVFGGWLQLPTSPTDYTGSGIGFIAAGDFYLGTNASGQLIVNTSSGGLLARTSANLSDGIPHHVMVRYDKSTNLVRLYVDGEEDTGFNANLGNMNWADAVYFYSGFTEFYAQDWAFWFNESAEIVADWDAYGDPLFARILYGAGINQAEMSTYFRFNLISSLSGFNSFFWRYLDYDYEYQGTCLEFNFSGKTLLQALQDVARTEQGFFFCDRSGRLRFMSRYKISESILGITQMIFTDDTAYIPTSRTDILGNTYCGYQDFGFDYDDAQLANSTQVVIGSGDSASYDADASITSLGKKSHSFDTLLGSIVEAQDMAEGLTNIYKDPALRLRELQISPTNIYQAYWLATMDIGDLIATRRRPQGFGNAIIEALTVLQVRHELTPQSWQMGIYASARPINAFFILDHSALDGPDILGF